MYWSINPSAAGMPAPARKDLLYEGVVNLDGSGNFTSSWFDTTGINRVVVAANYGPVNPPGLTNITIQEAMTVDGVNPVNLRSEAVSVTGAGYGQLNPVVGRFVKIVVVGGSANINGAFFLTVRGL
jgi:hypothetical protein